MFVVHIEMQPGGERLLDRSVARVVRAPIGSSQPTTILHQKGFAMAEEKTDKAKFWMVIDADGIASVADFKALHEEHSDPSVSVEDFKAWLINTPDNIRKAQWSISLEERDLEEVLAKLDETVKEHERIASATKETLRERVIDWMNSITKEQIAQGEVHKVGKLASAKAFGIVEYTLKKYGFKPKEILDRGAEVLPAHVSNELERIIADRKPVGASA